MRNFYYTRYTDMDENDVKRCSGMHGLSSLNTIIVDEYIVSFKAILNDFPLTNL